MDERKGKETPLETDMPPRKRQHVGRKKPTPGQPICPACNARFNIRNSEGFTKHVLGCCADLCVDDAEVAVLRGGGDPAAALIAVMAEREADFRVRVKSAAFSVSGTGTPVLGLQRSWAEAAALLGVHEQRARRAARATIEDIPLTVEHGEVEILFENDDFLAANKPSGLRSVPHHRFQGGSLLSRVLGYVQRHHAPLAATDDPPVPASGAGVGAAPPDAAPPAAAGSTPDSLRAGDALPPVTYESKAQAEAKGWAWSVHRLDKGTSGIVLFAKQRHMATKLAALFAARTVSKTYLALAVVKEGAGGDGEWVVDAPIGSANDAVDKTKQVVTEAGKPSKTAFKIVARAPGGGHALVQCSPLSGRRHQIRVHLAHVGMPIVGDITYGERDAPRMLLHAFALRAAEPLIDLVAPPPTSFTSVCEERGIAEKWGELKVM